MQHRGVKERCLWINVWIDKRNLSGVLKCYLSILLGHFDRLLLATSATKSQEKQENKTKKKTDNRNQVHMHTGNTKVGKFFLYIWVKMTDRGRLQNYYESDRSYSRDR